MHLLRIPELSLAQRGPQKPVLCLSSLSLTLTQPFLVSRRSCSHKVGRMSADTLRAHCYAERKAPAHPQLKGLSFAPANIRAAFGPPRLSRANLSDEELDPPSPPPEHNPAHTEPDYDDYFRVCLKDRVARMLLTHKLPREELIKPPAATNAQRDEPGGGDESEEESHQPSVEPGEL